MKLTILGNGGLYPTPGVACSGYLISHEGTNVLVDCGSGVLARLMEVLPLEALDAVILSHMHFDHMSDLLPMTYALAFSKRKEALPLIAPLEPAMIRQGFDERSFAMQEPTEMTIGSLRMSFHPGRHPIPSNLISVRSEDARLVYTGDTNTDPALAAFCQDADLLLADAGLLEPEWTEEKPHLSAWKCGELARDAGVKRLLLTHISPFAAPQDVLDEARMYFPDAELAALGGQYDL